MWVLNISQLNPDGKLQYAYGFCIPCDILIVLISNNKKLKYELCKRPVLMTAIEVGTSCNTFQRMKNKTKKF